MRWPGFVVCMGLVAAVACGAAGARATGYFNLPGTHAQWAGHGFGAGYHAPLLLGPMRHDGPLLGNQVRLPCSPAPCCGFSASNDCGRMIESPTAMPDVVSTRGPAAAPMANATVAPAPVAEDPTLAPSVESSAEPPRPIFPAPVQP